MSCLRIDWYHDFGLRVYTSAYLGTLADDLTRKKMLKRFTCLFL
jgi:hypothetical protein